ncbi:protein of unknown function [Xenorhabdus nematophila AN6/1]|nr:hypothetical protein XNA1_2640015 [Xenorhabdus nematophila str. Anatoliense]CEF29057.1 hypothetical protein XNW1_1540009 [Xenorhabdus nematophila str. Websteri]CEF29807.1 hypothetical protein XNW1_2020009 [Xenorhabdus nematophila str. Websteri]CEK25167.1 protein of unknown function [Xenorhabdus nematophila AN6/1]
MCTKLSTEHSSEYLSENARYHEKIIAKFVYNDTVWHSILYTSHRTTKKILWHR